LRVGKQRERLLAAMVPLAREEPGNAAERAARAGCGDERVEVTFGLLPDLRTGRALVRVAVRGVVELVAPDRAGNFPGQPARHFLVVVRVAVRHRLDAQHLGAERLDHLVLLGRLIVGHHDHELVTARVADVSEPDAGIARRTLDDGAAGQEPPAALGVIDDGARSAVFHRAAGIHELGLAEDLAARQLAEMVEPDQRSVADCIGEAVADAHAVSLTGFETGFAAAVALNHCSVSCRRVTSPTINSAGD
jgi:hypothetical protein